MKAKEKQKQPRSVRVDADKLADLELCAYSVLKSTHESGALRKARKHAHNAVGRAIVGAMFTAAAFIGGCAATVGSEWTQTHEKLSSTNGSANTTTISDNSGEKLAANGHGPASYTLADSDQARSFSNGATPTALHAQRNAEGKSAFSLFSAADKTISAKAFSFDPQTGLITGEGVTIGGGAAEATRAVNEALVPLSDYWKARDQQSRDVLIQQIQTTGEIPAQLAPLIVQLLLGL